MTDSELKKLCVETEGWVHATDLAVYAVLRQVLTLDPEPTPAKSKGADLAEWIATSPWVMDRVAAAIDKAIADELEAIAKAYNVSVDEIAKRLREREGKQEETR